MIVVVSADVMWEGGFQEPEMVILLYDLTTENKKFSQVLFACGS